MKFDQESEEFRPVTITLESVKEVQVLGLAISRISGGDVDDSLLLNLYRKLVEAAPYDGTFSLRPGSMGSLRIVEA